jgi:hypothetical protein
MMPNPGMTCLTCNAPGEVRFVNVLFGFSVSVLITIPTDASVWET